MQRRIRLKLARFLKWNPGKKLLKGRSPKEKLYWLKMKEYLLFLRKKNGFLGFYRQWILFYGAADGISENTESDSENWVTPENFLFFWPSENLGFFPEIWIWWRSTKKKKFNFKKKKKIV